MGERVGVEARHAVTAELFSIRAGVLLGTGERSEAPSYASGLLIGCDLRAGLVAACLYVSLPLVTVEATTAYIDLAFVAFTLPANMTSRRVMEKLEFAREEPNVEYAGLDHVLYRRRAPHLSRGPRGELA